MHCYPFVAIEGIDGAGKTTIRNLLNNLITEANIPPFIVGQHSWLNVEITRQIVNIREGRHNYDAENILYAYAKDKNLHSEYNIKTALSKTMVLSDRYIYSDAVYHDVLYQIPFRKTLEFHKSLKTLEPNIILYVEVNPSIAYMRLEKRSQRIQHYGRLAKLEPIHDVYSDLFQSDLISSTTSVIKFSNNTENIRERLQDEVCPKILQAFPPSLYKHKG